MQTLQWNPGSKVATPYFPARNISQIRDSVNRKQEMPWAWNLATFPPWQIKNYFYNFKYLNNSPITIA